jgi:integrase
MGHFREKIGRSTGKRTWQYRWKAPFREKDGTIGYRYIERSTGVSDLKTAKEKAKLFELEATAAATAAPKLEFITFAEAAATYMKNGGERSQLAPILLEIGLKPINEIDQELVLDLCEKLYPGTKPATWNRRVFTPISAVINFAAADKKCPRSQLKRPKGHNDAPPLTIPDDAWFEKVLPVCRPALRAIILLITLHGLRISEAVRRTPADIDVKRWTLSIPNTKTGKPVLLKLSQPVSDAIKAIPDWRSQRWLFGTGSRRNISRDIKAAATRAEVRSYGAHAIGRHKFASSLLAEGKSLHFVKDAGRWATIKMVSERYGHLEQQQVTDEVNASASARFGKLNGDGTLTGSGTDDDQS